MSERKQGNASVVNASAVERGRDDVWDLLAKRPSAGPSRVTRDLDEK